MTRARVYQLLNEAAEVVQVRWANGHHLVPRLSDKFQAELDGAADASDWEAFHTAVELFYPGTRSAALCDSAQT